MLQSVIVVRKCLTSVVGRVDVDALHTTRKLLLQRLQRQQVVPEDQPVVKDVVLRHAMLGVIRLVRVFEQDTRLQLRALVLADPGEFEFLIDRHHLSTQFEASKSSRMRLYR